MLDMAKTAIFIGTLFVSVTVYSAPLDIKKAVVALNQVRNHNALPKLEAEPNPTIIPSSADLPAQTKKTFAKIQRYVFGTEQLISLKSCNGCIAVAHANEMAVYLDPSFLKTVEEKFGPDSHAVTFILAHELSHFTYEYVALLNGGKSVNGNILLLTKSFMDYTNMADFVASPPDVQKRLIGDYEIKAHLAHAEVDALAVLTLKGMGLNTLKTAKSLLEYMREWAPEEAQADIRIRAETINESL